MKSALSLAARGVFKSALEIAASEPPTSAFRWAVHSLHSLATGGAQPSVEVLRAIPRDASGSLDHIARAYVWDALQRRDGKRLHALVTDDLGGTLAGRLAAAVLALAAGDYGAASAICADVEAKAKAQGLGEEVVMAASLSALAAVGAEDFVEGVKGARRAARMGGTEGLRQGHYFASLVLARARRLSGFPFLATHILATLQDYVSPGWKWWLDFEGALSSGEGEGPLGELLRGVHNQDSSAIAIAHRQLKEDTSAWAWLARDVASVERVVLGLDAEVSPAVAQWCAGLIHDPPEGISGLAGKGRDLDRSLAAIWTVPERRPLRLLKFAVPALAKASGATAVREFDRKKGRTGALLAALAFAGEEGASVEALFRAAYGFAYVPARHGGNLKVALHRVRVVLGETGEVIQQDGRASLRPRGPLVVPDPRSEHRIEDRVLQVLARGDGANAKKAAEVLGVSLRLSQKAIEELRARGLCSVERVGRSLQYSVEDTTFSPATEPEFAMPTSVRLDPRTP